ncbi:hypothetical protein OSCI_3590047 [Kamptonema sp. PCC 6506]|nr:hypothetical protein OSCI_3590047 [Kamptonema sp. PCC 6506]
MFKFLLFPTAKNEVFVDDVCIKDFHPTSMKRIFGVFLF